MSRPCILLVLETPRQHTPAMQRAFDLARRTGASVHVLLEAFDPLVEHAAQDLDFAEAGGLRESYVEERQRWVDQLVVRWVADGLRVTGEAVWAPSSYWTIVQRALDLEPRLVIKDAKRVTGVRRVFFSVLDWKLVRYCPAPLMLVHGLQHLPERILAAVDTGDAVAPINKQILREAQYLGERCKATVDLAHVFTLAAPQRAALGTLYERIRDDEASTFRKFAQAQGVAAPRRHFLTGFPPAELQRLGKALAIDLLVIGSAHRTALDRGFMGSTAAALVRDLGCDLLLVKPEGFARSLPRRLARLAQDDSAAWNRSSTGMRASRR